MSFRNILAVFFGLCLMATLQPFVESAAAQAGAPPVAFDQDSPVQANEGHLRLSWALEGTDSTQAASGPEGITFQLQRGTDESFQEGHLWDVGPDRASYVSGLHDGDNYFRVRSVLPGVAAGDDAGADAGERTGPWSEPLKVEVRYPSRSRVLLLMAVGGMLLVATVVLVLVGHRRRMAEGDA